MPLILTSFYDNSRIIILLTYIIHELSFLIFVVSYSAYNNQFITVVVRTILEICVFKSLFIYYLTMYLKNIVKKIG